MQFPILKNIWDLSFTIIRQQKRAEVASAISLFFSNVLKKIYISEKNSNYPVQLLSFYGSIKISISEVSIRSP